MQVSQVTVRRRQILCAWSISDQYPSLLETPFSVVSLTSGNCSPPLARASLALGSDLTVKLVKEKKVSK